MSRGYPHAFQKVNDLSHPTDLKEQCSFFQSDRLLFPVVNFGIGFRQQGISLRCQNLLPGFHLHFPKRPQTRMFEFLKTRWHELLPSFVKNLSGEYFQVTNRSLLKKNCFFQSSFSDNTQISMLSKPL